MKSIIRARDLKRLINSTKRTITDGHRQILQYIKLEFRKGIGVSAYGCDGFSLVKASDICIDIDEDFDAYIKPFPVYRIDKKTTAEIQVVDGKCLITIGDNVFGFIQPKEEQKGVDVGKYMDEAKAAKPEYKIAFDVLKMIKVLTGVYESIPGNSDVRHRMARLTFTGKVNPLIIDAPDGGKAILLPVRDRYVEE